MGVFSFFLPLFSFFFVHICYWFTITNLAHTGEVIKLKTENSDWDFLIIHCIYTKTLTAFNFSISLNFTI